MHWPDRYVPIFGSSEYNPDMERESVPIKETLGALWDLIKAGKIKHYGMCCPTPFCLWMRVISYPRTSAIRPTLLPCVMLALSFVCACVWILKCGGDSGFAFVVYGLKIVDSI